MQHCVARGAYLGGGAEYLPRVTESPRRGTVGGVSDPAGKREGEEEEVEERREEGEEGGEGEDGSGGEDEWGAGGEDDGYDVLAETIGKIAELSLLGGGDGGGMFYDDDDEMMASAFSDEQVWRVAL